MNLGKAIFKAIDVAFGNKCVDALSRKMNIAFSYVLPQPHKKTVEMARCQGAGRPIPTFLAQEVLDLIPNSTILRVSGYNASPSVAANLVNHGLAALFNCTDEQGHYFTVATKDGRNPDELLAEIASAKAAHV